MSAQSIYDQAPIGALIRYSDGTPRPPQRFKHKLASWDNNNNIGRLVRKAEPHTSGNHTTPASFTLHQGDFGSAGVVVRKLAADVHRRRTAEARDGARSRSGWWAR